MASAEPLLNFDALLAPVPGEAPAGAPVPYELRQQLDEDRRDFDPNDFDEEDPRRQEKPKRADWSGLVQKTQTILAEQSKDLLTAARLTEALVKLHGFAGLRDGLRLLRLLVEQSWDQLNPVIESEDDLDLRAAPFHWLDVPDRGARFPSVLRAVPIVVGEAGAFGWLDWKRVQDGQGALTPEEFDQAVAGTDPQRCAQMADDLAQAVDDVMQLVEQLGTRMGPAAPGLTGLRQAIADCQFLVQHVVKSHGSTEEAAPTTNGDALANGDAPALERPLTAGAAPASRAEAYRQLAQAAELLQRLEPHSPIPYLVQRAVALGKLPFPQLMRALIREQNVLAELEREMGIGDGTPAPESGESS